MARSKKFSKRYSKRYSKKSIKKRYLKNRRKIQKSKRGGSSIFAQGAVRAGRQVLKGVLDGSRNRVVGAAVRGAIRLPPGTAAAGPEASIKPIQPSVAPGESQIYENIFKQQRELAAQ